MSTPAQQTALYLTREEAEKTYGVSPNKIQRLRDSGKIEAFAIGPRLVRYKPESLAGFFTGITTGGDTGKPVAKGICNVWRARRNIRLNGGIAR